MKFFSDKTLVKYCKAGIKKFCNQIFKRYSKFVFNIAYKNVNDYGEAEDITQDFSAKKKQRLVLISGSVIGADNVTVELSGDASKSVTLNDGEDYSWELKAGGDYTLSASASGVEFEQSSVSYTNLAHIRSPWYQLSTCTPKSPGVVLPLHTFRG